MLYTRLAHRSKLFVDKPFYCSYLWPNHIPHSRIRQSRRPRKMNLLLRHGSKFKLSPRTELHWFLLGYRWLGFTFPKEIACAKIQRSSASLFHLSQFASLTPPPRFHETIQVTLLPPERPACLKKKRVGLVWWETRVQTSTTCKTIPKACQKVDRKNGRWWSAI